ncbi:hypothetical protein P154DRAFT_249805 [Amniculicola lignicola CBS 123094]|uniref:Uncharacterized protein n=1 Tax=Amniculicola lignicola CBS 123094 TaxID=1392246 RepID=A0A6A5WGP8_9PLEO|nr:hypothetical protein P154DRAFT_249805 [Amniculicola lignicola CBS 123094]
MSASNRRPSSSPPNPQSTLSLQPLLPAYVCYVIHWTMLSPDALQFCHLPLPLAPAECVFSPTAAMQQPSPARHTSPTCPISSRVELPSYPGWRARLPFVLIARGNLALAWSGTLLNRERWTTQQCVHPRGPWHANTCRLAGQFESCMYVSCGYGISM